MKRHLGQAAVLVVALVSVLTLVACTSAGSTQQANTQEETEVVEDLSASKMPTKIACVGDSITWGYGVSDTRDTDSYPAQLQALLSDAGYSTQVENYGYNGACALSNGKNPYINTQEYVDSLASGADMVIIMLGTNDAASTYWDQDSYESELGALVEAYQSTASSPTVVLMVSPSIYSTSWAGGVSATKVAQMQQGARDVAEKYGLSCIDVANLTDGHADWFEDGVHPNKEGNAEIAQLIFDTLSD
jgi:lysophospholipase L1-like esterase